MKHRRQGQPAADAACRPGPPSEQGGGDPGFVTRYRHYLTGEVMDARDYGYKAWPFGPGR